MDRTLSSATTFIHRRVIPIILGVAWIVDVVIAVVVALKMRQWAYLFIPVPTAVIFWLIYRYLCAPFADLVVWSGSTLLVRKGARETSVPLSQIQSIRTSLGSTPQRVYLELRETSSLGKTIVFVPQTPKSLAEAAQESAEIRELRAKIGGAMNEVERL